MPGFQRLFPVEADCGHRALEFGELSGSPGLCIADLRAGETPEPGKRRLHAVRERVIGELGVGEQRVAAMRRRLDGVEQGAERRLLQIGGVRVPEAAEIEGLLRFLDDRDHLRAFLQPGNEGIAVAGAEPGSEIALAAGREQLVAEEDHPVFEEGAANFVENAVRQRPGYVHAADFGPERACDRRNFDFAIFHRLPRAGAKLERAMGIEPTALGLGSRCSTTELRPLPPAILPRLPCLSTGRFPSPPSLV